MWARPLSHPLHASKGVSILCLVL